TRAGYFGTDNQGFIVNNAGHRLQGSPVDAAGNLQNGVIGDLRVLTANQAPQPTSAITQRFNLNSALTSPPGWQADYSQAYNTELPAQMNAYDVANPPAVPGAPDAAEIAAATAFADPLAQAEALTAASLGFDPADPDTYSSSTSLNIYDTQGNAHVMTQYFVKTGANTWD